MGAVAERSIHVDEPVHNARGKVHFTVHDCTPARTSRTWGIQMADGGWAHAMLPVDVTAEEFDAFVRALIDKRHEVVHA
jgi:hypothetical protein